jgi:hypothetical protein
LIQEILLQKNIFLKIKNKQSKRNSLKIFTSGNVNDFKNKLDAIGIKNKIKFFIYLTLAFLKP